MHAMHRQAASDDPEQVTIGYVGGGSRSWASTLMNDLALCGDMAGEVRLYDLDYDSAKQNERLGTLVQEQPEAITDWTYRAVETLEEALDGADFVVISTSDPPGETRVHDMALPEEYGIIQTVGDTVGPGGALRAMRSIHAYREIAATVRELCPDAWVINYSNPMTILTRTLYEEFPDIKAMGLCHEVFGTQLFIASLVEDHLGVDLPVIEERESPEHMRRARSGRLGEERPPRDEIDVNVKGVNHFTWIDEVRWRGRDLWPVIEAELSDYDLPMFEAGELAGEPTHVNHHAVTADLFQRFGIMPAAGDRHVAEFVPWYLDVDEHDEVHRWGIIASTAEGTGGQWDRRDTKRQRILDGEEAFQFRQSGEEMVDIMRALLGIEPLKTNANLPNDGQVADLQSGAVVETNALFTADSVTPLTTGGFPPRVRDLVSTHVTNQETLVEAGFSGDLDLAFEAFLCDPLVTIDTSAARSLFSDMVDAQRSYLEGWNFEDADVLD